MLRFRWETEFKETEIGEIPKDWEVEKLINICEINKSPIKAVTDNMANFIAMEDIPTDGIYPSFSTKSLKEIKSGIEVSPNTILLAKITPSFEHGKMCIVPSETNKRWFATTEVFQIEPYKSELFFIYYLLKHPSIREPLENSMSGTSGRQRVQLHALKNLLIPYPPLLEQSRIATVLSWFDELIENKKRQNEIQEKTAIAIFKSWFIDFEPFKDEEFVYNEKLGMEIPKGWEVKRLGEVAEIIKGRKGKIFEQFRDGLNIYLLIETFKNEKEQYTDLTEPFVSEEDIVLVADGESSGKILRYKKGALGTTLLYLKLEKEELKHYLYLYLKMLEDEIMSHRTGSAIPHLDKEYLKNFTIPLPPSPILQHFHSLVEPLFQKIILNQKQIMTLRKVRDSLLPLLVFGKLRVEEI